MKRLLVFILIGLAQTATAQTATPLDLYIKEALANNLVLQQKNITLEKSLLSLKEARSYFLPTTYFDGSYTLAQGGREITIPVGDLLNPVYQTLNQLTGTNKFPTIENVSEQLLPNNFYDLRIKTSVPVYNPALKYNRGIKEQEIKLKGNEIDIYKRELVREIKQSYYNILMSDKAIHIYTSALNVVNENLRTNQSLLRNGKGLPAYVSRAESEVKSVETQLSNANNEKQKAIAYFNSLRNANLADSVILSEINLPEETQKAIQDYADNINGREELKSLAIAKDINYQTLKFNKAYHAPRVNAFLDLAAQDFNFKVNNSSFFYLGGVQLTVPIFSGNRNLYAIKQTEFDIQSNELSDKHLRKNLELAAFNSKSNAKNSYNNFISSLKQEEAAQKYFKLIDRGYKEGINNFIEMLDARNQLTQSQLQKELTRYRLLAAMADYERQTSSYIFN
jgi:outer membrane protein TolC